jgi:hypothetical protein
MPPFRAKLFHAALLVAGLCVGQFVLFGPSLVGRKILLPLDILAQPWLYLSPADSAKWGEPQDLILSDPILQTELDRQFGVSEVRAGRLPLWNPHEYCGDPFLAANQTAVFSPFRILDYLWPAPTVIAWDQLLKTLVAGIGAYLFFRISIGVEFMPALIGAWLWPLCGFYIQWAGFTLSSAADWLPWLFFLTDRALVDPRLPWGGGLAVATCACLLSGHAETAAQILLGDGLFLCWRLGGLHRRRELGSKSALAGVASVLLGWLLGAGLSAPQSLPTLEYLRNSFRLVSRETTGAETAPVGPIALPQLFLPDFNGSTRRGNYYVGDSGNLPESASSGCVGLITGLVLAPLAFCNRKHRSIVIFAVVLGICGIGQILGIPLLKQLYESFPLSAMRENRLVLLTGWAIAILGVIGLDAIGPSLRRRIWFWLFMGILLALGLWALIRAFELPIELTHALLKAREPLVHEIPRHFSATSLRAFGLCLLALAIWVGILTGLPNYRLFPWVVGILAVIQLIASDFGVYPQCPVSEYYPRQPILTDLAGAPPGRVCGVYCFPAKLTESHGLFDIRGYDAINPQRLVELLSFTQPSLLYNPLTISNVLQQYSPKRFPSPVTRMMNLRYLIFIGPVPPGRQARFVSDGYWVYEDAHCLPRVFVPRRVEVVDDSNLRLNVLSQPDFNPAAVACVESPGVPLEQPADGQAKITRELPSHITIDYDMKTSGLIVLSDLWDPGWHATVNGADAPVLRVNHAFRGVMVPAGEGILQYDYLPASFVLGLKLAAVAAFMLLAWTAVVLWLTYRRKAFAI